MLDSLSLLTSYQKNELIHWQWCRNTSASVLSVIRKNTPTKIGFIISSRTKKFKLFKEHRLTFLNMFKIEPENNNQIGNKNPK